MMANGKGVKKAKKVKQGQGENRLTQFLVLLMLAGCCFGSFYLYRNTSRLVEDAYSSPPVSAALGTDAQTETESKDVDETEQAVSSLGRASSQVMQSARLAEISGRQPFGTTSALVAVSTGSGAITSDVIEEPLPPNVTIVAIMIKGSERVAMIDVDGEEGGLVVRQGSKFSGGEARITQINPEGVKYTWMRKSYEVGIPR